MSLTNSLNKIHILNEAPEDDLFDIDKEVDAQIKRVQNRIAKKQEEGQPSPPEDNQDNSSRENKVTEEEQIQPESEPVDDNQEDPNIDDTGEDSSQEKGGEEDNDSQETSDGSGYDYMDSGENIPDDYEAKQTIPELKILSTLTDSEYSLNNIRILEQFKELKNNVNNTITNIIMKIVTKNPQQRQIIDIVHNNLYDMMMDIDNFILYRNNDVYEENVVTYCTFLKRYKIATDIIKIIIDENLNKNT